MAILKLNGKTHFLNVNSIEVKETARGRWQVSYDNGARTFTVLGGRRSGGSARDWFCHHPEFYGDAWLPANSMIEAIKLGAQY